MLAEKGYWPVVGGDPSGSHSNFDCGPQINQAPTTLLRWEQQFVDLHYKTTRVVVNEDGT